MEISEIRNALEAMNEQIISYREVSLIRSLEEDIAAYEQEMSEPSFWR